MLSAGTKVAGTSKAGNAAGAHRGLCRWRKPRPRGPRQASQLPDGVHRGFQGPPALPRMRSAGGVGRAAITPLLGAAAAPAGRTSLTATLFCAAAKPTLRACSQRARAVRVQATAAIEKPKLYTPKAQGPIILNGQTLHSLTQERLELVNSMSDYVEQNVSRGFQGTRPARALAASWRWQRRERRRC